MDGMDEIEGMDDSQEKRDLRDAQGAREAREAPDKTRITPPHQRAPGLALKIIRTCKLDGILQRSHK